MAIVDLLTDDASIAPVAIAKNSPDYELKEVGCKDNKVENSEATSQWNERYGTTNNNFRIIRRRFSRFRSAMYYSSVMAIQCSYSFLSISKINIKLIIRSERIFVIFSILNFPF